MTSPYLSHVYNELSVRHDRAVGKSQLFSPEQPGLEIYGNPTFYHNLQISLVTIFLRPRNASRKT